MTTGGFKISYNKKMQNIHSINGIEIVRREYIMFEAKNSNNITYFRRGCISLLFKPAPPFGYPPAFFQNLLSPHGRVGFTVTTELP